jgi:ABC-type multidrug transport system fused ATPase/permease subunit
MKNLWFYRPFLIKSKWLCMAFVMVGVFNNIANLLIPLSVGRFYELMYHGHSNKGFIMDSLGLNFEKTFESFISAFIFLIFLKTLLEFLSGLLKDKIEEQFVSEVRLNAFQQQLNSQYELHQQKATAKYLGKFSSDFSTLKRGLSVGILIFLADTIFSIFAIIFLIKINVILTLVLIFGLGIHLTFLHFVASKRKDLLTEKQNAKSSYVNFISERLHSFSTIKIFERNRIERKRFEKKAEFMKSSALNYSYLKSLENALIPAGIYLTISVLLISIFKFSTLASNPFNAATSIAFILLIFSIRSILKRFLRVKIHWKNAELSIQKYMNSAQNKMNQPAFKFHEGNINFNFVSFGYDGSTKTLNNLSFEAKNGQITRICGKSCAGKTTVFRLITKLFSPQQGIIFIDGQDINRVSGVRKYIGVVSEEFPFVGKDVFEAVVESKTEESKQKVLQLMEKLCRTFQLKETISIHKKLVNGGTNLSQTEKKVLAYARAILSEKPILLFDEPFAGTNDQTTYFLGSYLNELKKNKTILVISSRSCNTIEYDRMVDLDKMLPKFEHSLIDENTAIVA